MFIKFLDKRHTQPLYCEYALSSTIAGQLPTFHAVRIYFPTDNPELLLIIFYVSPGLLLTPTGQPSQPCLHDSPKTWQLLSPPFPSSFSLLWFSFDLQPGNPNSCLCLFCLAIGCQHFYLPIKITWGQGHIVSLGSTCDWTLSSVVTSS